MKIGLVREKKIGEGRVASTPENIKKIIDQGHEVMVEKNAGVMVGFSDEMYEAVGAKICDEQTTWTADMILKVKEPQPQEYDLFKENQIIWGFLHLAASPECVKKMLEKNVTAIAGETISIDGVFKLLQPMSAIAGRRAVFLGAHYLEKQNGGPGMLLSGIDGVAAGKISILGGGNAAKNSAKIALGIGAEVTMIIKDMSDEAQLKNEFEGIKIVESTEENIHETMKDTDLFISTVYIPGAKPPKLVKEYMIRDMKAGSIVIDISIDQGGTIETIDQYTTHDNPTFEKHEVIHYAVPNMPGAVPKTATMALSKDNINYLLKIANDGLVSTLQNDPWLHTGVNLYKGEVTQEGLAGSLNMDYKNIKDLI